MSAPCQCQFQSPERSLYRCWINSSAWDRDGILAAIQSACSFGAYENQRGGWTCPCCTSSFDESGRRRGGPARSNLEIPSHKFLENHKLRIFQ